MNNRLPIAAALLLALAMTPGPAAAKTANLQATVLRCEYRTDPLGLDDSEWRRRCAEIEREVRSRYPYGDYFLEPEG